MRIGTLMGAVVAGAAMGLAGTTARAAVYAYDEFDGNTSGFAAAWTVGTESGGEFTTTTSAGPVAALGMALANRARKALTAKQMATTTLVRPVRPPTPIPAALST